MRGTLSEAAPGTAVRLRRIACPPARARRLMELGLVPGERLRVIGRGSLGGLVVAAGDARIAVDAASAALLLVDLPARA